MRTRLAIAVLIAAAAARSSAQTASQQTDEQPRPTFRAEANYVRVDMYATREDQPVIDLAAEEIEILEDGAPQKIATFEYVNVRPAGPQDTRIEPSTVAQSRQASADPRARVFVIFLDTHHIRFEGAAQTRKPVVQFLDRVIGQDDLVAVMTPEMSAADLAFGRKTTVISKMLDDTWTWGRRERLVTEDPRERLYQNCFGDGPAAELIARRREKQTFGAFEDLITYVAGMREERKAVLTISEGWQLFRPNSAMLSGRPTPGLGRDPIYVGPDGKLRRGVDTRNTSDEFSMSQCEADRVTLAGWDGVTNFHDLFGRANRGNVSFYTVDSRGLAVTFGSVLSTRTPGPASADGQRLRGSLDSLRSLAENTDGLTVQDTNAIDIAMRRIVSDLTSYYLIGYYSTNAKLDGKFREIKVRVKRPGVQVRARRGYRAATAEDLSTAAAGTTTGAPAPLARAFEAVAGVSSRNPLRIRAASWRSASAGTAPGGASLWVVGEVDAAVRKDLAWSSGATADVALTSKAGMQVAAKTIELSPGQGDFAIRLAEGGGIDAGEYALRVRIKPNREGSLSVSDTARVIVTDEPLEVGEAIVWRRGPATGPRYAMTADPRFRRHERLRVEHATATPGAATARLVDRAGKTINVPVPVTERPDASGDFRWLNAELALAPLAPGDYAIEVTLAGKAAITAFKVVP